MERKVEVTSKKLEDIRDLLNKYKSLRNELTSASMNEETTVVEEGKNPTNSFVRRKTKPGIPSMYEDKSQGGFVRVMMLAFFTLFFEILFLCISYFIFS